MFFHIWRYISAKEFRIKKNDIIWKRLVELICIILLILCLEITILYIFINGNNQIVYFIIFIIPRCEFWDFYCFYCYISFKVICEDIINFKIPYWRKILSFYTCWVKIWSDRYFPIVASKAIFKNDNFMILWFYGNIIFVLLF